MSALATGDWVSVDGKFGPPLIYRFRAFKGLSVCQIHWPGNKHHGRDTILKTRRLAKAPQEEVDACLRNLPALTILI